MDESRVIVIGAGMAGLAAGRRLAEAGRRVLLLEAQDRVGGRIRTERPDGVPVELGAEFVHGKPPELLELIREAGLTLDERTGELFTVKDGALRLETWEEQGAADDPLERLRSYSGPDCSFLQYLDGLDLSPEDREAAVGYVEGYNAATAAEASVQALGLQQAAEDSIEGDRLWWVRGGYDQVPEYLDRRFREAGGELRLRTRVQRVQWSQGRVEVITEGGTYSGAQCVIAVPLGVLQAGEPRLLPPPESALRAARQMRMGPVFRLSLRFRKRLWPAGMSFLLTRGNEPAVWWTRSPNPEPVLTGWAGGPRASALLALPQAAQVRAVADALKEALALPAEAILGEIVSTSFHDWQADEFSRGAYSWVPVGGIGASRTLAQTVEGTLFFAGEHTDTTGHWGTVHAAYGSGLRAAAQILESARER